MANFTVQLEIHMQTRVPDVPTNSTIQKMGW
jgi:hypothetical protein